MKLWLTHTAGVALFLLTGLALNAQPSNPRDTSRRPGSAALNQGLKPYKEIITDKAKSDPGLFTIHRIEDKYYFEIPDSLLGRDLLVVNRLAKAAAGMRSGGFIGYAGDQIGQNVIRFEKGPNNKLFLRTVSFAEYAKDSTSPMFTAVSNSNIQPIAASFEIKSLSKDSAGSVIEVTDYLAGDNDILHFNGPLKSYLRLGTLQSDKSYIVNVRSFPVNIEIRAIKTYSRIPSPPLGGGFGGTASGNMTVELNSSILLLPRNPMQARYFDPRVGFFAVGYTDYDANPQGVKTIAMIKRWKLEPKPEDRAKYDRGELVEPQKPIVFYIDPSTPAKWVPYLIEGVNDWKGAFEKAGFRNAISARMAPTPEEDSSWSLDDATNSAIVYKPSDIANASGPSIADPRSGEIIESHINWYHNIMELLHNWYFIQTAAVDPKARKMQFDDSLMGQLIRFACSHEVGHALGLRHNLGSSSTVPVEKLRDRVWLEANGHTPSIMDYARFNYVAQPEDSVSEKGLFPRIGDYDRWAIEWGYRQFPEYHSPDAEKTKLNNWVIEKLKDRRLWFGRETNPDDPRSQTEQLGDDAVKAGDYGIRNLKRILPHLMEWTKLPNEDYVNLSEMYNVLTSQFNYYLSHVSRSVGGIMETPKKIEEQGPVYENVSREKQKESILFLQKQVFETPTWLINEDIFSRTGQSSTAIIGNLQDVALGKLLSVRTLSKLLDAEAEDGAKAYSILEFFRDLKKGIWSELISRKPIDIYRRNLQKSYVSMLDNILNPPKGNSGIDQLFIITGIANSSGGDWSDVRSVVRAHLVALRPEVLAAAAVATDPMTKFHLQDLADRIGKVLNPKD